MSQFDWKDREALWYKFREFPGALSIIELNQIQEDLNLARDICHLSGTCLGDLIKVQEKIHSIRGMR